MRLKPSLARKSNQYGFTPIHLALEKSHIQTLLWLVDVDNDLVRVKGREGLTPLHFATERENLHLIETFLTVCPKSIEDTTIRNETPLHIALKNNKHEAFQVLMGKLQQESNDGSHYWKKRVINCKDVEGNTLLHIAASRNQSHALQLLADYDRLNPGQLEGSPTNNNGLTALDLALRCGYDTSNIQRLLRQFGVGKVTTNPCSKQTEIHDVTVPIPTTSVADNHDLATQPEVEEPNLMREGIFHWAEYFKFDFGKNKPDTARTDLLVVAVLMATATYQAALSPPGGLADDKVRSLLASETPYSYVFFVVFNSLGFFLSLETIRILIYNYPLYHEIYAAMLAMTANYDVAIASMGTLRRHFWCFPSHCLC